MEKKYYLYILQSEKDKMLYVGHTDNIERRLIEHNNGFSKSTKPRRPFRLVYQEEFPDKSGVAKKEWYLKNTAEGSALKKNLAKLNLGP